MKKLVLVCTILFLLISQATLVLADSGNVSKEIEQVETVENGKIVYYKDGTKEMFVTLSENLKSSSSVETVYMVRTPPPTIPFNEIFRILKLIFENIFGSAGLGCFLLAWKIWNIIKGLRRGRPRDYRKVNL